MILLNDGNIKHFYLDYELDLNSQSNHCEKQTTNKAFQISFGKTEAFSSSVPSYYGRAHTEHPGDRPDNHIIPLQNAVIVWFLMHWGGFSHDEQQPKWGTDIGFIRDEKDGKKAKKMY